MSRLTPTMRRLGLLVVPVLAAVGLLVAGCGNYTEKKVSPLPNTVSGKTTAAATTEAATSTEATSTEAAATTEAAAATGDAAAGKAVFTSAGCAACHTLADAGASGAVGPNLDQAKPSADLVRTRVENGMGAMPSFKAQLSAKQIDDVVAYVSSAAGK